jgi:hypothetical protein
VPEDPGRGNRKKGMKKKGHVMMNGVTYVPGIRGQEAIRTPIIPALLSSPTISAHWKVIYLMEIITTKACFKLPVNVVPAA